MKRLIVIVFAAMLMFSGCISLDRKAPLIEQTKAVEAIAATEPDVTPTAELTLEPTEEPTIEPTVEPTPEPTEKPGEAVIQKKSYKVWKDSIGSVWISVACLIANVGESPVRIDSVAFTVEAKDGSVLGTVSANMPVPDVIGKNGTAYAFETTILQNITDPKLVAGVEINGAFSPAEKARTLLTVSNAKFYPPKKAYDDPKVTGWVTNKSEETADDVRIACALYDKKGNLLIVLADYLDSAIGKGSKAGFDASVISYPPGIIKSVASVKCIAFNWSWD